MRKHSNVKNQQAPNPRQSVTFTPEQHIALVEIAERNHVSVGWVIRYACEQLIRQHTSEKKLLTLPLNLGGIE